MKIHQQICKITGTRLGFEAHGLFTAQLDVDYGSISQSIGGFVMSSVNEDSTPARSTPHAADFVIGVLRACGVPRWEKLVGRTIYALFEGDHMPLNAMPLGIENLPTEPGERFLFADWQRRVKESL